MPTKWILSLLILFPAYLFAHQVDISSTVIAEGDDGKWVVQTRASLAAFEYEIARLHGDSAYATPEEFKELVIRHFQQKLLISFNGGLGLSLQNGVVNLGHETSVVFELLNVPTEIESISVSNLVFANVWKSQNALVLLKKGFDKKQSILNKENNYQLNLRTAETGFVVDNSGRAHWLYLLLGFIVVLVVIIWLSARSRSGSLPTKLSALLGRTARSS